MDNHFAVFFLFLVKGGADIPNKINKLQNNRTGSQNSLSIRNKNIFKKVRSLIIDMEARIRIITSGSHSISNFILFTVNMLNCATPMIVDLHFTAGNDDV